MSIINSAKNIVMNFYSAATSSTVPVVKSDSINIGATLIGAAGLLTLARVADGTCLMLTNDHLVHDMHVLSASAGDIVNIVTGIGALASAQRFRRSSIEHQNYAWPFMAAGGAMLAWFGCGGLIEGHHISEYAADIMPITKGDDDLNLVGTVGYVICAWGSLATAAHLFRPASNRQPPPDVMPDGVS